MGKMQRNKGATAEREVARLVADLTGFDVRRRIRQHEGDSDLLGVPSWSIEVKRYSAAVPSDIRAWYLQAEGQAGDLIPALFYRLDRRDWRVTWPVAVILAGPGTTWRGFEWTVDSTPQVWAAVVLEQLSAAGRPTAITEGKQQ
jgi:hypothetical protein